MNLPNKLTVFRILLVPIMVIIAFLKLPGELLGISYTYWLINIIFIIASITDHLDGKIARARNQITTFGKFLDPIADKILVIAAMVLLVEFAKLPAWIPITVIFREFIVSGYRLLTVQTSKKVIAASIWGKVKTVTQITAIILAFIDTNAFASFITDQTIMGFALVLNIVSSSIMLVSVIATICSGIDYLKDGKDLLRDIK